MKTILLTVVVLVLIALAGGAVILSSGVVNVSTDVPDPKAVNWLLDTAMNRSVGRHAAGIQPPPLSDPALIRTGRAHFQALCVMCHGAPGVARGELAAGLFPPAPYLGGETDLTPAEQFWIVKHGVKYTGMPGWGATQSDDALWAVVAFLQKLPALSESDYAALGTNAVPRP